MADTTNDHIEITALAARYGALLDRDRIDEWLELFTPDAAFHVYGRSFDGHAGLRKMAEGAPGGIHMGGLPVITVDTDTAQVGQSFVFVDRATHETRIGWYDDELVRVDGRWLIQTRRCTFATPDGPSDRP
jgi:hypothetical protein